ncbi:MAG: leucyl aminopeptidase family protein [Robiginitomaculum sp.]
MSEYFINLADVPQEETVIPVYICRPDILEATLSRFSVVQKTYISAQGFRGKAGQLVSVPDENGAIGLILFGAGHDNGFDNSAMRAGSLGSKLTQGFYTIAEKPDDWPAAVLAIAWGMGAYKFTKYLKRDALPPKLVLGEDVSGAEIKAIVKALHRGRDMINTGAGDMGPKAMQSIAQGVADAHGAKLTAVIGDDLLAQNYPMIYAVGRAAHEAPRLIEINWGDDTHPRLSLVGKGITFDTGGLNLKSAVGMRIMKKDMGGAAHALALADMIMAAKLPVRLHVLLAVAENAVSGNAFRPGDVLSSRKGLSVEIDNTDAEGRLVLGDAITKACEDKPKLVIDFATLTGAARVALGPTLAPFFSNRDKPVQGLLAQGNAQSDPFWHMPLWQPYNSLFKSSIADMQNAGSSFAGSITAALFLQKFVSKNQAWMHFDVYGWNPTSSPARPKGGEIMCVRAVYEWLKAGGLERID